MGTVIKFPRVRGHERRERPAGASAEIIILPVVRIERLLEPPAGVKAKAAKSVAARGVPAREAANAVAARAVADKSAAGGRKRRKRIAPALPAPACGRG